MPKKKSTNDYIIKWKTPEKKYAYVVKHVMEQLKNSPKTFADLMAGVVHLGVREQYLSNVLCDMLLHDKTITSEEHEIRFYKANTD